MMNEGTVKIRFLENPASRIIYDLFAIFGHISDTSLFSRIIVITCVGVSLLLGVFFQIAKLIMTNFELVIVIDVVPSVTCLIICLIYLPIGYGNRKQYDKLRALLEFTEIQMRTEEEEKIKEKYDKYIMIIATVISVTMLVGSFELLLPGLVPPVLDFIFPLNESRHRALPFQGEHFVDEEEYFYEILLFQYINVIGVIAIAGSIEVIFLMCIVYTCGTFEILECKLENTIKAEDDVKEGWIRQDKEIIFKISQFIESHNVILKFVEIVNQCCDKLILLVLGGTLLIISISLVQLINPHLTTLKSVLMSACALGQFFVVSLAGQLIINYSEKLPHGTYNSYWYRCSAKIQKLFVMIIMKTCKPCGISPMNTFLLSFQNFSAVIQTGVSYAMVLKQFDE